MRTKTTVAVLAVGATAFATFLAPAAGAGTGTPGAIKICVVGTGDVNARVEIDRYGGGTHRAASTDACVKFRNLASGRYNVDVDPPRGWRVMGHEHRRVQVQKNETTMVTYRLTPA